MSRIPSRISVIIAVRKGQTEIPAVRRLESLAAELDDIELIVVAGTQPSQQRNRAADESSGEILYFLDDDSLANAENFSILRKRFADPNVAAVGGPSLSPSDATMKQQVFNGLMASRLVFGPSRARYCRLGKVRNTTEKELILCNLGMRAEAFIAGGRFDESLYPNEENALMAKMSKRGEALVYDPEFGVFRYPRESLSQFLYMLFRYGRGRGEQVRLYSGKGSFLNFVPAAFVVYLLGVGVVSLVVPKWLPTAALPLGAYVLLVTLWVISGIFSEGLLKAVIGGLLTPLAHIAYGVGSGIGLLAGVREQREEPQVTSVRSRMLA